MKSFIQLILFFFTISGVYSQSTFNRFDYWFGSASNTSQSFESILKSNNSIYSVLTVSDSTHAQYCNLIKCDLIGNFIKKTNFYDTTYISGSYPGHCAIIDQDSNIVFDGFVNNNQNGNVDGFVIKLNSNLDTLWTRIFNLPDSIAGCSSGQNPMNYFTCLKEDPNGGYILGGHYWVNCQTNNTGLYLTKYDTAGNLIWVRTYPGIEGVYDFEMTNDGSFYIASKMNTTPKLIKIDENGIYQWNITTYSASNSSWPLEVEIMDSNYLIVSSRFRYDFNMQLDGLKVSKINYKTKQQIWSKDFYLFYNFRDPDLNQYAKLRILPNKDILVAGTSQVFAWDSLTGGYKGILFRLNQNGDSLWTRYYHTSQSFNDDDVFCDVELMDDGGFLAVGYHKPWVEQLNWAAWMVRTDSLGNAPMDGSVRVESAVQCETEGLKTFPNPTNTTINIQFSESQNLPPGILQIFSIEGKLVKEIEVTSQQSILHVEVKNLSPGLYLGKLTSENGEIWSFKFVKE